MQITIDVPAAVGRDNPDDLAARARLLLVIDEVRAGRLTRAGAAKALGMPIDAFVVAAGKHGLYAIDYDLDDFRRELADIKARGF